VQNPKSKLTQDDISFAVVFLVGLAVVVNEGSKCFDDIPGNENWDGTKITAAAFFLGVLGVLSSLIAYVQNFVDRSAASKGQGLLKEHIEDVRTSYQQAEKPSQDASLERLENRLNGRNRFGVFIGSNLAKIGIIGTMAGSVIAFGGIQKTVEAVGVDPGNFDLSGMVETFGGLRGAMISSIVALGMGIWVSALSHFNKGITTRLYHTISQITEQKYLRKLPVRKSEESRLLGSVIQGINNLVVKQDLTNKRLAGLEDRLTQNNDLLGAVIQGVNNLVAKQDLGNLLLGTLGDKLDENNALLEKRQNHQLNLREATEKKLDITLDTMAASAKGVQYLHAEFLRLVQILKNLLDDREDKRRAG